MLIPKNERTVKNKLYQRLKRTHYNMMRRCYDPRDNGYYNYGAKGSQVWEGWHDFEGFLDTVDTVEGWDPTRYVDEKLVLDKDKVWGNKLYSPEMCRFITAEENNKRKPNQQYRIVGYSPDKKLYKFTSAHGFAKEHNLSYNTILKCAKGEYRQHRGWQFCMLEDYYEGVFTEPYSWEREIIGLSPEGDLNVFTNASEFARENRLLEATVIYACANGKNSHTRMWQFRYADELEDFPFVPIENLVPAGRRDVLMEGIDPEGNVYQFTNKTKFAEEHGLSRGMIHKAIQGKVEHHRGWKFRNL